MMDDHTQEDFTGNNTAMNNLALPPGVNIDDDIVNIYVNPQYYRHQDHTSTNQLLPEGFAASFTELEPQYGGSSVGSGNGGSTARRRRTRRVLSQDYEQNYSQQRLYPGHTSLMHQDHHHHHHHQQQQQQQQQYEEEQHPRLRSPLHALSDESSLPPPFPHAPDSPRAPRPHHPHAHGHQRRGRDRDAPHSHYPREDDLSDEICFRDFQK